MRAIRLLTTMTLLVFGMMSAAPVFAQDVDVTAEVSSGRIDTQTILELKIKITGDQSVSPMKLPEIDGFDSQYVGASRGVTIINGQYSSSLTFVYNLFPKSTGNFSIPSFTININGREFVTDEIPIVVTAQSDAVNTDSSGQDKVDLDDKIFMAVKTPASDVYVNQKIPVKVLLFVGGLEVRDIQYPELKGDGIIAGEQEEARQYQQVIEGIRYDVVEFNTFIYPTRVGEVDLSAELESNILYKTSRNASRSRIDSVFNDAFFGELLGRHEKRPIKVKAPEHTLTVNPLPEFNEPGKVFSGAVGTFEFDAEVGPESVKTGDPLTLRMALKGNGDLSSASFPKVRPDEKYKLYDPSIKEENGFKTYEQVIIPQTDRLNEIPELNFVYFDPEFGSYRTITAGPFKVDVQPLDEGEKIQIVGGQGVENIRTEVQDPVGSDIVYIKESPGAFRDRGVVFFRDPVYWFRLTVVLGIWAGVLGYYFRSFKIRTDSVYARKLKAPRKAKEGIRRSAKALASGDVSTFYSEVFATLKGYLHYKLNIPQGEMTKEFMLNNDSIAKLDQTVIRKLEHIVDICESVRFAGSRPDASSMDADLKNLETIIDHMERKLK